MEGAFQQLGWNEKGGDICSIHTLSCSCNRTIINQEDADWDRLGSKLGLAEERLVCRFAFLCHDIDCFVRRKFFRKRTKKIETL